MDSSKFSCLLHAARYFTLEVITGCGRPPKCDSKSLTSLLRRSCTKSPHRYFLNQANKMRNFGDNTEYDEDDTIKNYPAIERVLNLLRSKLSIETPHKSIIAVDVPLEMESEESYENLNRTNITNDSEHSMRNAVTVAFNCDRQLENETIIDSSRSRANEDVNLIVKCEVETNITSIRDRAIDIVPAGRRKYFIARQLALRSLKSRHPS